MNESVEKDGQRKDNDETIKRQSLNQLESATLQWRCFKLLVDPDLTGGGQKLCRRYDGHHLSTPDAGFYPVDAVRDPRINRLWTTFQGVHLPVPKFKVDENYVGAPKELTFARLNDNIRDGFLTEICKQFGEIQDLEVLYNPKNKKHLGIAKVIFESVKAANKAVQSLQNTPVMGNNIHVEFDPKGVKRKRYFQMLVSGLYTPFTLPVGSDAWGPQSPSSTSNSLSEFEPLKILPGTSSSFCNGSPSLDCSTPLSMDTAYSSMHQDTPSSFWQTPQYQDTPSTPFLSLSRPGSPTQSEIKTSAAYGTQHPSCSIPLQDQNQSPTTANKPVIQPSVQNRDFSNRQRTPRRNSNPGNNIRRGLYFRPLGSKYQNAYNRRPQQHYVHRPLYRRFQGRSGLHDQKTYSNFQESSSTSSFSHKSTSLSHCTKETTQGQNVPGPVKVTNHRNSSKELRESHIESDMTSYDTSEKNPAQDESMLSPAQFNSNLSVGEVCSGTSQDLQASSSEFCHDSLDARIQMLLETGSSILPLINQDSSDSEIVQEEQDTDLNAQPSHKNPDVALNCDQTSFMAIDNEICRNDGLLASDIGDVNFSSAGKSENETQSLKTSFGKTPSSNGNTSPSEDDKTSSSTEQPSNIPVICSTRDSLAPPFPHTPPPSIYIPPSSQYPSHPPHLYSKPANLMAAPPRYNQSTFSPYPPLNGKSTCRPPNWQSPVPLPIPTRITHQTSFSRSFLPSSSYVFNGCSSSSMRMYRPPCPSTRLRFDPPPVYAHKATVDGVLAVVASELRVIVKKDINRRMIEVVAFKAFDLWWEDKARAAKDSAPAVKPLGAKGVMFRGMGKCGEITVPGSGKISNTIKIPSFKLKRKNVIKATPFKRICGSSAVGLLDDEGQCDLCSSLTSEEEHQTDPQIIAEDVTQTASADNMMKRRHSRPMELDSDDEDKKCSEDLTSEKVDERKVGEILESKECVRDDDDVSETKSRRCSDSSPSQSQGYDSLDSPASPASVSDSSVSARSSSEYGDSKSVVSVKTFTPGEDHSNDTSSVEEETWISSDEETMYNPVNSSLTHQEEDLSPPVTPSAPDSAETEMGCTTFDEDLEEELSVRVYMQDLKPLRYTLGFEDPVKECLTNRLHLPDPVKFFSEQESQSPRPPSPSYNGLSDDSETEYTANPVNCTVITETLEENFRPITPSGSLSDNDLEMDLVHQFSPAMDDVELPHTPGGGLELEEAEEHVLRPGPSTPLRPPPSPTGLRELPISPIHHWPVVLSSYLTYEIPKTPGRMNNSVQMYDTEETSTLFASERLERTFKAAFSSSTDSGIPRTPGRDMSLSPPVFIHGDIGLQNQELWTSRSHFHSSLLSDLQTTDFIYENCSAHPANYKRRRGRLKIKQQTFEGSHSTDIRSRLSPEANNAANMPLNDVFRPSAHVVDGRTGQKPPEVQRRPKLHMSPCPWRRWRASQSSTPHFIFSPRSERREKLVLHAVWTKGVNEEEIRHLKASYENLLQQEKEFDWLSSTHWIPHPHILEL